MKIGSQSYSSLRNFVFFLLDRYFIWIQRYQWININMFFSGPFIQTAPALSIYALCFSTKGTHSDSPYTKYTIHYFESSLLYYLNITRLCYQYYSFFYELKTLFRTLKYILTHNSRVKKEWWFFLINLLIYFLHINNRDQQNML